MIPVLNIVINRSRIIPNSFCEAGISLILKPDKDVIERKSTGRPCGPVVKNLPASAGDMGSIPGPERSHACAPPPLRPHSRDLCSAVREAPQWEAHSITGGAPTRRNWKRPVCKKTQRSGNEDRQKVFWEEKYRTISLMNVDAKLFTKILASQIEQCIKWIRYYNQVGFISGMRGFLNIQKSR